MPRTQYPLLVLLGMMPCCAQPMQAQPPIARAQIAPPRASVLSPTIAPDKRVTALALDCLLSNGEVFCWGDNFDGKLGNPATARERGPFPPHRVAGLGPNVRGIAAEPRRVCAITEDGGVMCWGNNNFGETGDVATLGDQTPAPARVRGLTARVRELALGNGFTCAILETGDVMCWGSNWGYALGTGRDDGKNSALALRANLSGEHARAIAAGRDHACVITEASRVMCWGADNVGQLAATLATTRPRSDLPAFIDGEAGQNAQAISAREGHTCVVDIQGVVRCWGNDFPWRTESERGTPIRGLATGVRAVTTGENHHCAILLTSEVVCWGDNRGGNLGTRDGGGFEKPVRVDGLPPDVVSLALDGAYGSCALARDGRVRCWGTNAFREGAGSPVPTELQGIPR